MAAPTRSENYGNQVHDMGDAVAFDATEGWDNVTDAVYTSDDLPPGLTMQPEGSIAGAITFGGVIDSTIHVDAPGGKSSAGIKWYVS